LAYLAVAVDSALSGYGHFQFTDYNKLTIIGVVIAGWPVVAWLTTSARRLYLLSAIIVTILSLAPNLWILHLGQPGKGVLTLVAMHFALAGRHDRPQLKRQRE
jgi:hypothetical protein